jgi:CHAT domain-containing protein
MTLPLENKLRKTQSALMRLYSGDTDVGSPAAQKRLVDSLNNLCNTLESQIARRNARFRRKKEYQNVNAARVATLLPTQGTLIEYVRWTYADIKLDKFIDHYLAAVIPHAGKPFIQDLGDAWKIDDAIKRYRKHMVDLSDRLARSDQLLTHQDQIEYSSVASELYRLVWQPVETHVRDKRPVFIAPDAGLNLISFAGLLDTSGTYLIEKYPLHYLTAGRDVLRLKDRDKPGSGLVAFGDPDYDAPVAARRGAGNDVQSAIQSGNGPSNIRSACGNLKDIKVGRLFNTRQEVDSVAEYWKQDYMNEPAAVYTGARASEENFKVNARGKRAVHLATHGYFIQNECLPKQSGKALGEASIHVFGENPLLQSGLFLAGSNLHGAGTEQSQSDDGVVTALEVSSLDLRGVELVTLSACETALGEVRQGEGVYGLRRAFQLAGARTVVSALWRVPDNETKALMKTFYAQKSTTYPALMQKVALEHIHDLRVIGRPTHPYSWGGFIATGDWRRQ